MNYKKYQILGFDENGVGTRSETNDYNQLKDLGERLVAQGFTKVTFHELADWMRMSENISYDAIKAHGETIKIE